MSRCSEIMNAIDQVRLTYVQVPVVKSRSSYVKFSDLHSNISGPEPPATEGTLKFTSSIFGPAMAPFELLAGPARAGVIASGIPAHVASDFGEFKGGLHCFNDRVAF